MSDQSKSSGSSKSSASKSQSSRSQSSAADKSVDTSSGPSAEELGSVGEQPVPFEKSSAQVKAEKAATERSEEVRELQLKAQARNLTNVPSEPVAVVHARRDDPEKTPDSLTLGFDGSTLTLTSTSNKLELGREEALSLVRAVTKIGGSL